MLANGVKPWTELPLWLPENDPTLAGMNRIDTRRALESGLAFRPLEDTIHSTLDWVNSRPAGYEWQAGISRERETELLRKANG